VGIFALLLMFLAGSFRTGETARICLFIYPYIFVMFRNVDDSVLANLVLVTGAQTILMQLFGYYLW
jgi:hypothetical protein